MTIQLDTREARPLTSREISKIMCAILSGVRQSEPSAVGEFHDVMQLTRTMVGLPMTELDNPSAAVSFVKKGETSWKVAFYATMGGLTGWCERKDVETAVLWVSENLPRMFPSATSSN